MTLRSFLVRHALDAVLDDVPAWPYALDRLHADEFWHRLKLDSPTAYADLIREAIGEIGDVQAVTLYNLAQTDPLSAGRLAGQVFDAYAIALLTRRHEERGCEEADEVDDNRERVRAVMEVRRA